MPVNDDRGEAQDTPGPWKHLGVWKTRGSQNSSRRHLLSSSQHHSPYPSDVGPHALLPPRTWARSAWQESNGRHASLGHRGGLRCRPPSIWQGSAPGRGEDWPRPGPAAPTWRAAVDEKRQACGQAEAGQEGHRSWGEMRVSSSPSPEGEGSGGLEDRLTPCTRVSQEGIPLASTLSGSVQWAARTGTQLGMRSPRDRGGALGQGTEKRDVGGGYPCH